MLLCAILMQLDVEWKRGGNISPVKLINPNRNGTVRYVAVCTILWELSIRSVGGRGGGSESLHLYCTSMFFVASLISACDAWGVWWRFDTESQPSLFCLLINRQEAGEHRRSGQCIRENLFERESHTKHLDFQPVRGTGDFIFYRYKGNIYW